MTLETKEALENLTRSFESFKSANDERLAEIEAKGKADSLTEEKLSRMNRELDQLQAKANKLQGSQSLNMGERWKERYVGIVTVLSVKAMN